MNLLNHAINAVERGRVPDFLTRTAIRHLCRQRLRTARQSSIDRVNGSRTAFLNSLRTGPIALLPQLANAQHYELPAEFFTAVLGPLRKYSCCYFPSRDSTLAEAEATALQTTCQRAELADGQKILELGAGWGSLSLWMAEKYPHSHITTVSNSHPQRHFIAAAAQAQGLSNLQVITADMNTFSPGQTTFDRVVSVEMFEHMRNYEQLLQSIASWLRPHGKLFIHLFCHRNFFYPFESDGATSWMGRHFFSGGIMPSANLLQQFDQHLQVARQYTWNGQHYQYTANAWLANLDSHRKEVLQILSSLYGSAEAPRAFHRWRVFFLAVAETFGFAEGQEWFVSHYLMEHAEVRPAKSTSAILVV